MGFSSLETTTGSRTGSGGFGRSYSSKELRTSEGLYGLALDSGLGKQADEIVARNQGESGKEIFSGGFISDIFDVLNSMQYGVTGMLKGKSFIEGVKTRQSFSDKDALGDNGLPGVIAGIVLDIAVDPLTYIAPATIVRKIPFATKLIKGAKEAVFGRPVEKAIEGTEKTFTSMEGGSKLGKYTAQKFSWTAQFNGDAAFEETWNRSLKNTKVATNIISQLPRAIVNLGPEANKALKFVKRTEGLEGGVLEARRKTGVELEELLMKGELTGEQYAVIKKANDAINEKGQQLVDFGVLSKQTFEKNFEEYIGNAYLKHDLPKEGPKFAFSKIGIKGTKGRIESLTQKVAEEKGQIKDAGYLYFKTLIQMTKDVENARLFRDLKGLFATDVAQEGFKQLPKSTRLSITSGKQADILMGVKDINTKIKPLLNELKATFKSDKETLAEIARLEKRFESLSSKESEELYKFFNVEADTVKTVEASRRLGVVPEKLQPIANSVKKYASFEELQKSKDGIELEKLFINGDLERNGFKSMEQFFETVKNPYKAPVTKEVTRLAPEKQEFDSTIKPRERAQESDLVKGRGKGGQTPPEKQPYKPLEELRLKDVKAQPTKITVKELNLLKLKIKNLNTGFKAGNKAARKGIESAQSDLIQVIKNNFPKAEQWVFLTKLKNATTPEKLNETIDVLKTKFEDMLAKQDELAASSQISKVVQLQRDLEQVLAKGKTLKEIDKRSIDDSFRSLEQTVNDLRFSKEGLLEDLADARLGDLAGKFVPESVYDAVTELVKPFEADLGRKVMAQFKEFKVIMNPATHARNIMSNPLLNWFKLGIGPWRADLFASAVKDVATKNEWYQRAVQQGGGSVDFVSGELRDILAGQEFSAWGRSFLGKAWNKLRTFMGNLYQNEETVAKMVAFKEMIKRGLSDEEAWKAAESATFNYAQVTPFVRKLRESLFGFPFITFTVKSTPVVLETAYKHPQRIGAIGKIKQGIEKLSDIEETERERASEPAWVKDGFYIKLPMKDKGGLNGEERSAYFDLTYILPFGDLLAGNFFERGVNRETGLPESFTTATLKKSPFINLVTEIGKNQDFYGNKIWKESDSSEKQLGDLMRHLTKSYIPPVLGEELGGGYNDRGERQIRGFRGALKQDETENQRRTVMEELLRNIGAKIQPVDADIQESFKEWNTKKGLQTLLLESGVTKEFNINYVPKQ